MKYKIAVYGTLKKGFENHYFLKDARLIGEYWTSKNYKLLKCSVGLPYLVEGQSKCGVFVEIYEIDPYTLFQIDQLECHPEWYKRKQIDFDQLKEGVEVYILPPEQIEDDMKEIKSGDYLK